MAIQSYKDMAWTEAKAEVDQPAAPDRDAMESFRAGDREAFTGLYRAHQPAVFRFALHMTGDPAKAADVTQDVFVWLADHARAFDPERAGQRLSYWASRATSCAGMNGANGGGCHLIRVG